jgi:hypothetical protein
VSNSFTNPFDARSDPDRHWIWHHLVAIDSDAFALGDWSMIEGDFAGDRFEGIRCAESSDPDDWTIAFATLTQYRDSWLAASREYLTKQFVGMSHREAVYRRCRIERIDVAGERALVHKKFSGDLRSPTVRRCRAAARRSTDCTASAARGRSSVSSASCPWTSDTP